HHVLGAVGEIDDVEHSEDDRKPEAQQCIERAVDQADQELAEQRRGRDAEDFEHGGALRYPSPSSGTVAERSEAGWGSPALLRPERQSRRYAHDPHPAPSAPPSRRRGREKQTSPLHKRAPAFAKRPEGFSGRNRGAGLVEVARILGFGRLLHLE